MIELQKDWKSFKKGQKVTTAPSIEADLIADGIGKKLTDPKPFDGKRKPTKKK